MRYADLSQDFKEGLEIYIRDHYSDGSAVMHEPQSMTLSDYGEIDLGELEPGFSESVIAMARAKFSKLSDFYNKAGLSRQIASKMNTDPDYLPVKHNAFACVIALELTMTEAEALLKRGSYTFSRSSLEDIIVAYFIEQRLYNMALINETLDMYGQHLLGSL